MTVWYGHLPIARSASLTIFAHNLTAPLRRRSLFLSAELRNQPVPHAWLSSALASSRVLQNP
jgi:hypothetical protein